MSEGKNKQNIKSTGSGEETFFQRVQKLNDLRTAGIEPYGSAFPDTTKTENIKKAYLDLKNSGKAEESPITNVRIAGRLTAQRIMGKSAFCDIKDSSGRLQIYGSKNELGDEEYLKFKKLDIGDIIGVEGDIFETKKGEITLKVHSFKLLSKCLRTLPEKWHGLTDIEQRYRQRYLDLMVNDKSREIFKTRFAIIREIRKFLEKKEFIEVETPMLQPIAGGAAAKPFKTFYEALHVPVYLRIAPELYLKRLLVGGFEKIYEMNRNFRNEGISKRHNPEFTMIEIYQAYGDCTTMMELVEELVSTVAKNVLGTLKIKHSEGKIIDITPPWKRIPYKTLIKEKAGDDWFDISHEERVKRAIEMGLDVTNNTPDFEVTNEVYEKLIEHTLIQPVFVTKLPAELVPLAKRCTDDDSVVDVFELEINGQELAPGYSELNDPLEQRKRFEAQLEENDSEERNIDEDFLTALEHGMPPAGGMGIGIDRLVMTLTGAESIRDVILFPQLKPIKQ